jgi:hypothetical protein
VDNVVRALPLLLIAVQGAAPGDADEPRSSFDNLAHLAAAERAIRSQNG